MPKNTSGAVDKQAHNTSYKRKLAPKPLGVCHNVLPKQQSPIVHKVVSRTKTLHRILPKAPAVPRGYMVVMRPPPVIPPGYVTMPIMPVPMIPMQPGYVPTNTYAGLYGYMPMPRLPLPNPLSTGKPLRRLRKERTCLICNISKCPGRSKHHLCINKCGRCKSIHCPGRPNVTPCSNRCHLCSVDDCPGRFIGPPCVNICSSCNYQKCLCPVSRSV